MVAISPPKKTIERVEKLRNLIAYHRKRYHQEDISEISDEALDSFKKELFDLEQKYPELITPDSPTQRVAGKPLPEFKKFTHPAPMISLNDAFSREDLSAWETRFGKLLPHDYEDGYYCELKIDGLAIELVYKNTYLSVGATRGDGKVGEDVTQNLKTVEAIPLKLLPWTEVLKNLKKEHLEHLSLKLKKAYRGTLVVRGEIFMGKNEFEKINHEQKRMGLKEYANPRNLAAGSIRQLDPKVTSSRRLNSYAYDIVSDIGQKFHEEEHKILSTLGFKTNPHNALKKDLRGVQEFRDKWEKEREKLSYEIDGTVVILNNNGVFARLGFVGKAPRGAIAYKFSGKEVETVVENIIFQVGRTGVITPVAELKPVLIAGSVVSRATLHNEDEIKRLDLRIGDTVILQKAGDVIPDVVKVLKEMRTGKEKVFVFPKKVYECGGDGSIERAPGQVAWRCKHLDSPTQRLRKLAYFVSKKAFNVDGLGPKILELLMEHNLVSSYPDIFSLTKGDMAELPGLGELSADNLIKAIEKAKTISLGRLIISLSIPHVGEETALDIAKHFQTLPRLRHATLSDYQKIEGIGEVVAESLASWFESERNKKMLDRLLYCVEIMSEKKTGKGKLKGKILVFTGAMPTLSRDHAKEMTREEGGDVSSSVSKETDYVVAGEEPREKYKQALKLGVKIIGEKEFLKLLGK